MKDSVKYPMAGIIVFLAFSVAVFGQLTPREIDHLVEDAMEKFTVAGVAVGIVKDGEIIHSKGYGLKSVDTGEKVDENSAFAIASNSKAFTTAALAILVEEGKLNWTDRVADHIPEFKMYNDYVTLNFNIQDLLTHRSGLGLGAGDLQIWPTGSDFTMDDLITNFQYFEPVSAFRTKYDYDNILYSVAGELIKRVSGISWETFVKERIMEPLAMDNSYTVFPEKPDDLNMAAPHMVRDGNLVTIAPYFIDPEKTNGAAAGILASANDLCLWLLVHLNEGKYGDNLNHQLFSEASQKEMWKVHTTMDVKPDNRYNPQFSGYGLGWRLSHMNGMMTVSHTGFVSGMLSKTIMVPDLDLGVVVLTNSYYGGAGVFKAVSQTILDSYLGIEAYNWTGHYLSLSLVESGSAGEVVEQVWETVETGDHGHIRYEDYTGLYEDRWFGTVEVFLKDGQPWFASQRSPKLTGPMYHYKANAFAIRWEDRELDADAIAIFSLDEEGKAQKISMKGISPDIDFSYDFHDLDFELIAE